MYLIDDSTESQNLGSCGLIFPKTILIVSKTFLNFKSDTIEEQKTTNLNSHSSKSFTSVVPCDSKVIFLW